jgi:2-dehydropantoate 2-reductase
MRVLVAGVGAVGGWLLARLAEGGADVTGWARGETYERLAGGDHLTLRSPRGDWSGPVRVVERPDDAYDLTFVCTKSGQTEEASAALHPGGTVVSVQNGIDNPAVLARRHARVIPAVVYSGCVRVDPVTVHHTSNGFLVTDDAELAGWLNGHGVRADLVVDVAPVQWRKLAANVVNNSLSAILDSFTGPFVGHPAIAPVIADLVAEVESVARAGGVDLPEDFAAQVVAGLQRLPAGNGTSMLYDRRAGRELEVEGLTGAVVRRADGLSVAVPTVRTVDALARWVSDAATGRVVQPPPASEIQPGG